MRRLLISLLLLGSLLITTGCPKYRPTVDFENPGSFIGKLNTHLKKAQHNYECYRFGAGHTDAQGLACTGFTQDDKKAQIVRNELLDMALPYIDSAYVDFITDIQAGRDRTNFVADLVDLGAAAAVGITNGERPLQIIGVALTAFRGGRKAADANFYKDQSTPILISQMDGNRAKARAAILDHQKLDVDGYSLGAAISDIVEYYNAGTLVRAFTQLQHDTARATEASEAKLADLKRKNGIRGAVPAVTLAASNEFSGAIRAIRTAYGTATANIAAADTRIASANQTITSSDGAMSQADDAISQADKDIGAATAQISAAGSNSTAKAKGEAAKAKAEAAKAKAETAKAKAEKDKNQATTDKQAAETVKADAIKARDQALDKLRGIFDAISDDSKLSPLLSKSIEEDNTLNDSAKNARRAMLDRLKQKPTPSTDQEKDVVMREYVTILLQFQGKISDAASTDEALVKALRDILNANK